MRLDACYGLRSEGCTGTAVPVFGCALFGEGGTVAKGNYELRCALHRNVNTVPLASLAVQALASLVWRCAKSGACGDMDGVQGVLS